MSLPGLSEIEGASWDYLSTAAANWNKLADTWEKSFTEVRTQSMHPGGTEWEGTAADAAQARTDGDMMRVRGPAEQLRDAAKVAERGRDQQEAGRRTLVSTVEDVRSAGFTVDEDYHVSPTKPDYSSTENYVAQMETAKEHENFIKSLVVRLVDDEGDLSRQLTAATSELDGFGFPADVGEDGGAGAAGTPQHATLVDDVQRDPVMNNDATTPIKEPQSNDDAKKDDLEATIPNIGVNLGGDGKQHHPWLNGKPNPLDVGDGTRPLPTGTAQGPNGQQLAFYSQPPYEIMGPDGKMIKNPGYVTPNSAIVDLNNPGKIIGHAPVAQASGVYDPATNTMYVVGNPGDGHGKNRELWSAPVDPNNPNGWIDNLQKVGPVLEGNRESQITGLEGGGYLLTGAADGDGVRGVTASSPLDLVGKTHGDIIVPNGPEGVVNVYGPTVVSDHFDPATGTDTVTLRTSQFAPPGSPDDYYDPSTFTSTFTVSQPPPAPLAPPQ